MREEEKQKLVNSTRKMVTAQEISEQYNITIYCVREWIKKDKIKPVGHRKVFTHYNKNKFAGGKSFSHNAKVFLKVQLFYLDEVVPFIEQNKLRKPDKRTIEKKKTQTQTNEREK